MPDYQHFLTTTVKYQKSTKFSRIIRAVQRIIYIYEVKKYLIKKGVIMLNKNKRLGDILVDAGLITDNSLQKL
jgi:hypothetical protein